MSLFHHNAPDPEPERLFLQPVDDDSLADDLWPDEAFADEEAFQEELRAQRNDQFRAIAGLGDFLGVILGALAVLLLVALLLSLFSWVRRDLLETFSLLQHF